MPLNEEACARRNRLAALRDRVDALPLSLLTLGDDHDLERWGGMDKALERINKRSQTPLTSKDVYVFPAVAATAQYVHSRAMFLGESTLRNVARDAGRGVSFMNSHRTGGLSQPSELPFGYTIGGKYNSEERETEILVYMVRGVYPGGSASPSTDDLYRIIQAGTIQDVSVGLTGGSRLCDVCTMELSDDSMGEGCKHAPGTKHRLTPEDQEKQKKRGVKKGVATFTLNDAVLGEVSAVYRGACPGAGFRKTRSLRYELSPEDVELAEQTYEGLAIPGDFGQTYGGSDENHESDPPAGLTLAAQLDLVLAAIQTCTQRASEVRELRIRDARDLNPERWRQLAEVHRQLGHLLQHRPTNERFTALQKKALALLHEAGDRP